MAVPNVSQDDIEDHILDDISLSETISNTLFSQNSREKDNSKSLIVQDLDTTFSTPEGSCTNDRKVKRVSSDSSDNFSSPNRESSFTTKRRRRNYRPRVVESSSDEEMSASKDKVSKNLESDPNDDSNTKEQVSDNVTNNNCDKSAETSNHLPTTSSVSQQGDNSEQSNRSGHSPSSPQFPEASSTDADSPPNANSPTQERRRRRFLLRNSNLDDLLDSDDDDSSSDDSDQRSRRAQAKKEKDFKKKKFEEGLVKQLDEIKGKPKPRHNWHFANEIWQRQCGSPANRQSSVLFGNKYYDSLSVVLRLQRFNLLEYHSGCVNALNFDPSGQFLASGSDDILIIVWDWCKPGKFHHFDSGHKNNVFQTKFMPLSGSTHIVSCARDGQVRLAEYSNLGEWKTTRRLAKHSRTAHKVTTKNNSPYEVLSVGEDGVIFSIDIRTDQPEKIVHVKDRKGDKVPLYSIHGHPLNDQQFCVCGQDEYVRVYDTRILSPFGPPAIKYCPTSLIEKKPSPSINCAVYSNNGDAILASYNDEDCFLFDTSLSEGAEPIHRYSGHRTGQTVKGVNFFGPSSRYIVSGSDCGNIFFWDRETEAIVNCLKGDEMGVVNVLEPHPSFPILATSGLDSNIKIWKPTALREKVPNEDLWKTVMSNLKQRQSGIDDTFSLNSHMLMMVFQEFSGRYSWRNYRNRTSSAAGRPTAAEEGNDDMVVFDVSDSSSEANDSDDSDIDRGVQCATH